MGIYVGRVTWQFCTKNIIERFRMLKDVFNIKKLLLEQFTQIYFKKDRFPE